MPNVGGVEYPYTDEGEKDAELAKARNSRQALIQLLQSSGTSEPRTESLGWAEQPDVEFLDVHDLNDEDYNKFVAAFPDWRTLFGRNPEERSAYQEHALHNSIVKAGSPKGWTSKELRDMNDFGEIPDISGLEKGLYYDPKASTTLEVRGQPETLPVPGSSLTVPNPRSDPPPFGDEDYYRRSLNDQTRIRQERSNIPGELGPYKSTAPRPFADPKGQRARNFWDQIGDNLAGY